MAGFVDVLQTPLDFKEVFSSLFGWHKAILKAFPALTSYSQACRLKLSQSHLNFLHICTSLWNCSTTFSLRLPISAEWPSVFAMLPKAVSLESQETKRVYNKLLYLFHLHTLINYVSSTKITHHQWLGCTRAFPSSGHEIVNEPVSKHFLKRNLSAFWKWLWNRPRPFKSQNTETQ